MSECVQLCVLFAVALLDFWDKFFELFFLFNSFGIQKTFPGQNVVFMMTGSKPIIFQCAVFVSPLNESDRMECISETFHLSRYHVESAGKSNNITLEVLYAICILLDFRKTNFVMCRTRAERHTTSVCVVLPLLRPNTCV